MSSLPKQISSIGHCMFERRLTDMAGGNISARDGNIIYITPRYSGSKWHWQLSPRQILVGELTRDDIIKRPEFSREGRMHLYIYRAHPEAGAIVHAHPHNVQPFCAAGMKIPNVLEAADKFGVIDLVEPAQAHSEQLAINVTDGFKGKDDQIKKFAAAVLIPRHGIVVVAKDLLAGIDALERIDLNAWCLISQGFLIRSFETNRPK